MSAAAVNLAPLEAGTRALVLGLGRTGLSCARYLQRKGLEVRVADTRAEPPGASALRSQVPAAELHAGTFTPALLEDVAQVVISPGLSLREPVAVEAARRGLPVVGDIELFARETKAPVAAVTGTNGKSTVTALLADLASAAGLPAVAGGNLGEPVLDLLERPVPALYVLELSSYQLETMHSLHTAVATVLNVTPDHLDRYDSIDDYAAAKARIFDGCEAAVVNADDERVRVMPRPGQRVLSFSVRDADADYFLVREPEPMLASRGEPLVPLSAMKLQGEHNAANALAALAMCEVLGLRRGPVLDALATFGGLPHRAQWVADIDGVRYVNDSKGTNVGATVAAVQGLAGPLVLIAGGDGKNQDFQGLRSALAGKVRHAVLIGRDAAAVAAALDGVCTTERAADMPAAVAAARAVARPGETVLLSPACASLDMYRDYAHRGEVFAAAVRSMVR